MKDEVWIVNVGMEEGSRDRLGDDCWKMVDMWKVVSFGHYFLH